MATHNWRISQTGSVCPRSKEFLSQTSHSNSRDLQWRDGPQNVWLGKPTGLTTRRGKGLEETEVLLSKSSHTDSLALGTSKRAAVRMISRLHVKEIHLLILNIGQGGRSMVGLSLGNGGTGRSHFYTLPLSYSLCRPTLAPDSLPALLTPVGVPRPCTAYSTVLRSWGYVQSTKWCPLVTWLW